MGRARPGQPVEPGRGLRGEDMAIKTLRRNGYRIIERNFRSRLGRST
jgi:Holliday junction resolvase-like predicted endonuclease